MQHVLEERRGVTNMRHCDISETPARLSEMMERHQRDDEKASKDSLQCTDVSPQLSARFTAFYAFHLIKINRLINQIH